jgi:hypothetical protein
MPSLPPLRLAPLPPRLRRQHIHLRLHVQAELEQKTFWVLCRGHVWDLCGCAMLRVGRDVRRDAVAVYSVRFSVPC